MQYIKQKLYDEIQVIKKMIMTGEIDLNEGYMCISYLVSLNSPDTTKTGSCIVSTDNQVISYGYNAPLKSYRYEIDYNKKTNNKTDNSYGYKGGKTDDSQEIEWVETKYPYVLHAERQAIYSAYKQNKSMEDATIYATLFPCNECALAIIESGISKLYYHNKMYMHKGFSQAAIRLFDGCDISYEQVIFKDKYLVKKITELGVK